ncbi:adenosylcobinamide-GDP ribazoletransferase [Microlunatus elymi]|uniref:Adenosylcobinamide-GDP ribazoletransferase n=2 Tax=Microlunatus elymi TaxID=2596828 RepID=A0A516Q5Z3_9ACTN|nr:adenosylcobinamide-GDP ribazoletransferase [Microlunatus elymi]
MNLLSSLRVAVSLLTIVPIRARPIERRTAPTAMILAPLAVVPVGVGVGLILWLAHRIELPWLVTGLLGVAAAALGTRAFHLDGLADTVDALGSGWNRDKALEIMRKGDIGPMGVIALIIVIGLQASAFGTIADDLGGAAAVGLIICLSRAALSIACVRGVPAARPSGLGALVAGSVPTPVALINSLIMIMIGAGLGILAGVGPIGGMIAVAAGLLAALLLVCWVLRRIGGVTGDVMGASVELAATVTALCCLVNW